MTGGAFLGIIRRVIRLFRRARTKVASPPGRSAGAASILQNPFLAVFGAALIVALAGGAIQMFGDPSAAGPHSIIALAPGPANADAAPHVSLSDVAEPSGPLDPSFEFTDVDDLPTHGLPPADANGGHNDDNTGVRISMVETDPSARASLPSARPLPRAPIAALTQPGPNGVLPIVASDGRNSVTAYARPFSGDAARPKIAIIVGGLGFNARQTTQAIDELPAEVTLSFAPYAANLQSWIDRARARGHEVMLELPMEPFDPQADDTGPQTLLAAADSTANIQRLENLLSRGAGYFAVTNYQGARFAASAQASAPIVQQLRRRGLAFISTGIGQRTALSVEAARAGLLTTAADRIIDARREADAIDEQLLNLEALALQNGNAIGAGFAYPVTMVQIASWSAQLRSRGYVLAPASTVLAARAQPRR